MEKRAYLVLNVDEMFSLADLFQRHFLLREGHSFYVCKDRSHI